MVSKRMNTFFPHSNPIDWTKTAVSVVILALGIWFVAGGFTTQWNATGRVFEWNVVGWYIMGVTLLAYGKIWAHRAGWG